MKIGNPPASSNAFWQRWQSAWKHSILRTMNTMYEAGFGSASHSGQLDQRARDIFRQVVESYLETGDPLGSRVLSKRLSTKLSPATVRNVMSDLESLGLIYAPHTSAGRLPTDLGLRFFVDSFMEIGNLPKVDRAAIEARVEASSDQTFDNVLAQASQLLSGLSRTAGLVVARKADLRLKHIEFIRLEPTKALAVIVGDDGSVENRILALPPGTTASSLVEAANFINAKIAGRTLAEARKIISASSVAMRSELDALSRRLVDAGVASWAGSTEGEPGRLIISNHANLIGEVGAMEDLERVRQLFSELEAKENFMKLLELAEDGDGVRIFIGAENKLFSLSGSSVIVAPYRDGEQRVIGALGIIGPTRLDYARLVPMVDFTAQLMNRILR